MKVTKTLLPGQAGTKKLVSKYGHNLVGVRYRDDKARGRRVITVELIEHERPLLTTSDERLPMNKIVNIRIGYQETQLRRVVKAAGGKWNPRVRAWALPYGEVIELGLVSRVLGERS